MNARAELLMDTPTFLRWAEAQDGRYELVRGKVVGMVRVSRAHMRIVMRLAATLHGRLPPDRFEVTAGEFALETGPSVRFPDVMVEIAGGKPTDLSTTQAVFLAEVLSPSSLYVDMNEKPAEYTRLPTLRTYIVFSQKEPCAWVWERGEDGAWPERPMPVEDRAAVLTIPALSLSIAMADLYEGFAD